MNRALKAFALLLLMLTSLAAHAYDYDDDPLEDKAEEPGARTSTGIGLSAGYFTGIGFTYRQFLFDNLGIQLVGPGFNNYSTYSATLIIRPNRGTIYAIAGVSRVHYKISQLLYGMGPGVEFSLIKPVGLYLELPAYVTTQFGNKDDLGIGIFPSAGILVHF